MDKWRSLPCVAPRSTPNDEVAFERALEMPIHGVEYDIRLCRDGEMVVVHDPIIDRVADDAGVST